MKGNKRSVSKPRENIVKSSPSINKSNIVVAKQQHKENQPILSKNALELIDKISDERFKNIKSHLEKDSKKTSSKVVSSNLAVKRHNLQSDVIAVESGNISLLQSNNKNRKNEVKVASQFKLKVNGKHGKEEIEMYVRRIQRWFRRHMKRRRNDPQIEMKMLLKKKKMSILRNYKIKSNDETSLESFSSINKIEKNEKFINNDKESVIGADNSKFDNIIKKINSKDDNPEKVSSKDVFKAKNVKKLQEYENNTNSKINNLPESNRLKSTIEEDSSKRIKEINEKKENTSKITRNDVYDQRPKNTLNIEDLEIPGTSDKKEEKTESKFKTSLINDNIGLTNKKNEHFDFNNNSLTKELSELNLNNDIFTPNSNLNLNFNDHSKNIFSPLKNIAGDEDKVNFYNPLFTNQNNSITEEVKDIIKSPQKNREKKDPLITGNDNSYKLSQNNDKNTQFRNNNDTVEKSITDPKNLIKNNFNISSTYENKTESIQDLKHKNDTLDISNISNSKPQDKPSNNNLNKPNLSIEDSKLIMNTNTTNDKINKILNYLDETKQYSPKSNISSNFIAPNVSSFNPQIRQTSAEILNMALELKEYKNTVATMKQVIEELKQVSKQKDEYYRDQYSALQDKIKADVAMIVENKDSIIDNLVAEKRSLVNEMETIKDELSRIELNYNKKITLMTENFEVERKKDKDAWYVAEKARRKKWEETKIKEIKEMTIKGLEPEIERILQNHKQEMIKWEENTNEELRKQKERLNKEFEKRLIEQREKMQKEKEEALEHERNLFLQRARNQSERFEDEYSEERRRWNSNLNAEISKVEVLREKDRKIHLEEIKLLEEKNQKILEEKEELHKQRILDLEKRLNEKMQLEIEGVRFRANKEKEVFIEEKQREFDSKYNNMKGEIMKDKEKQIELIIQKLGDETIAERRKIQLECETKAEDRNKILKIENEQMRNKIIELNDKLSGETKVRMMLDDNLNVLSKRVIDFEHETAKKDKKILELKTSLNEFKDKYSNVSKDFTKEKITIETDFQIKIDKHISDMKIMTEKYENVKNYYENKLNEMKEYYDSQINMIDSRVKKKLDSKEDIIKKLQEDLEYKNLTIQKYEEMLSRQRKELLMN